MTKEIGIHISWTDVENANSDCWQFLEGLMTEGRNVREGKFISRKNSPPRERWPEAVLRGPEMVPAVSLRVEWDPGLAATFDNRLRHHLSVVKANIL